MTNDSKSSRVSKKYCRIKIRLPKKDPAAGSQVWSWTGSRTGSRSLLVIQGRIIIHKRALLGSNVPFNCSVLSRPGVRSRDRGAEDTDRRPGGGQNQKGLLLNKVTNKDKDGYGTQTENYNSKAMYIHERQRRQSCN